MTYAKDATLYKIPILVPTSLMSEICDTQGICMARNVPAKHPYTTPKTMMGTRDLANVQKTKARRPMRHADGDAMLKRPTTSARNAGTIRPTMLPAFMADTM